MLTARPLSADGLSQRAILDKTVIVRQLHVVEAHGILLFRTDKMGKDEKPVVF